MKHYRKFIEIVSKRKTRTIISTLALIVASSLVSVIALAANDLEQPTFDASTTHPITDSIKDISVKDRATLKGQAIAHIGSIPKERRGGYFIEVERIEPIDGGVQLFARVWDKNDNPIGFGRDGTVEIERFRFFNPPILVEDASGDIVKSWTDNMTGEIHERHLSENLREALLQSLEHTIAVKKEKFGSEKIIIGKVGNTTDTIYPTSEGSIYSDPNATWMGARDATTGTLRDQVVQVNYDGNYLVERAFINFDTSAIPDTDTISSATESFKGTNATVGSPTANIYSSTASDVVVADDLDLAGATEYSDARITSWNDTSWNNFALNTAGIAAISKTGLTKTALRVANYDGDNVAPATNHKFHYVGLGDTSSDPNLVIEHGGPGPSAPTSLLIDNLTNPSSVATTSPYFSAVHANASTTVLATSYQIQVATSSSYWGAPYWDSAQLTLSSSTPTNMRTPNIFSTTTFPIDGSTYYWRIRLWSPTSLPGDWSTTTASFTMTAPPVFDALGHGSGTGNFSVGVSTSSGNNRLLVCGLYVTSTKSITGVTAKWNTSETMTQVSTLTPGWAANANMYYFSLLGGTSGNHNIDFVVTSPGGTVTDYATCASYTGVAQTGQPNTSAMHTETSVQSLATSNKTVYTGSMLIGFTFFNGGNSSAPTAGSGTTLRDFTDTTSWYGVLADSGTTALSVGNPSLNINRPVAGNMATLQASWAPVHN